MIRRILGAQKIYNLKIMIKNNLEDFAYRNICFLNFLNASLNVWKNIHDQNSNNNVTKKMKEEFLQKNENNLKIYNVEKATAGKQTQSDLLSKKLKIREWILENKIKISNNMNQEEINALIYLYLFPKLKEKIISLIKEKNLILQFIFPQLIKNIFDCFLLFKEIKSIIYKELKEESQKYTNLLIESNEKENSLEERIKKDENLIKKIKKEFGNQNSKQEEKILNLEELIKQLNSEIESQKNFQEENEMLSIKNKDLIELNNSLFSKNQFYESGYLDLKSELKELSKRFDSERMELKSEIKKLQKELNLERNERRKMASERMELKSKIEILQKELNLERNERREMAKKFKEILEKNKEFLGQMQAQYNSQIKELKKYSEI